MYLTAKDIRKIFIKKYKNWEFVEEPNWNWKMIEIMWASFIANEDAIFWKVNRNYVKKEIQ